MEIADALTRLAAPTTPAAPAASFVARAGEASPDERETTAGSLGRDEFLKMLLAQLQNQDPLNPQDATEFTAQLATFSMLEQLIEIQSGIGRVERLLEDTLASQAPAGEAAGSSATPRTPIATLAPPRGPR